jgi:hypothetical protein
MPTCEYCKIEFDFLSAVCHLVVRDDLWSSCDDLKSECCSKREYDMLCRSSSARIVGVGI